MTHKAEDYRFEAEREWRQGASLWRVNVWEKRNGSFIFAGVYRAPVATKGAAIAQAIGAMLEGGEQC
jgi:hypothetical protein